ncbi:hypothetical protein K32_22130 [Kaistia sp. 32K]|uniref:hypothetical protein n=1 Tax=Kaistia sp. 32K TaxID=2795690 RepID=UPI0019151CCA|nr:hypothetical protein [Kaistia sp. 32K]BCP53596.1 hypothetical protein K32_22130 [Kaistia sp. 32K]
MKTLFLATAACAAMLLSTPAAFSADPEPKPYEALSVTYDTSGTDDPELAALVETLKKAIEVGDVATLKASAAPEVKIYSPMIGFPDATPPAALSDPEKRPGGDRLDNAAALTATGDVDYSREDLDGLVVDLFGNALDQGTLGHSKTANGAICSPAEPVFDRDKALAVADAAGVPASNLWILSESTEFRDKPNETAAVLATLPEDTIVPFLEGSVEGEDGSADWYSVALPSGKTGYATNDISRGFQATSVCYGKVDGKWAVTAVIVPGL